MESAPPAASRTMRDPSERMLDEEAGGILRVEISAVQK